MPATVALAGPVARRVYEGRRLVSVCFDAGNPAAIALGDLAACVPGFRVLLWAASDSSLHVCAHRYRMGVGEHV